MSVELTTCLADEVISDVGGDVRCAVVVVGAPVAGRGWVVLVTVLTVLVE